MSVFMVRDAKVFLASYDLTGHLTAANIDYGAEALDATTLGSTTRSNVGGLKTVGLGYAGYWDAGASSSGPDAAIYNRIGVSGVPVTIAPQLSSEGARAFLFSSLQSEYQMGGTVGELLPFTVTAEGDDTLVRGVILRRTTAASTTANATGQQVGTSTGKVAYAALHVFGNAGGSTHTLGVKVQSASSSGFSAPTDRITFTSAAGATAEWGTPFITGTTDDWWRAVETIGGSTAASFDYAVSFGLST